MEDRVIYLEGKHGPIYLRIGNEDPDKVMADIHRVIAEGLVAAALREDTWLDSSEEDA